jgi:hypothetical protein
VIALIEGRRDSDFCDGLCSQIFMCVTVLDLLRRITSCARCTGIDRKSICVTYGMKIHISGRFAGQLSGSSKHREKKYLAFEY